MDMFKINPDFIGPIKQVSLFVPFQGFYNTVYEYWLEQEIENCASDDAGEVNDAALSHLNRSMDWRIAHFYVCRDYVKELADFVQIPVLRFKQLHSPREYNFETDRIECLIPESMARFMVQKCIKEYETLEQLIRERHSSRSGFVSFYSDSITEWLRRPFEMYDENHLSTFFVAYCEIAGINLDSFDEDGGPKLAYYHYIGQAISSADWDKYNEIVSVAAA